MESNLKLLGCNFGFLSRSHSISALTHSFPSNTFFAVVVTAAAVCTYEGTISYCCCWCCCCCGCHSATLAECALNTHITTVSSPIHNLRVNDVLRLKFRKMYTHSKLIYSYFFAHLEIFFSISHKPIAQSHTHTLTLTDAQIHRWNSHTHTWRRRERERQTIIYGIHA